jgi:hypothetical protein
MLHMKTYMHFCSYIWLNLLSILAPKYFEQKFFRKNTFYAHYTFPKPGSSPPLILFVKNIRNRAECAHGKLKLFLL